MNRTILIRLIAFVFGVVTLISPTANALDATTTTQSPTTKTAAQTADQTQRMQTIQTKGAQEIDRRLATLTGLSTKIASAAKLNAGDKTTLTNEVTTEQAGLTALKTKLAAETTVDGARGDAQTIINGYRVYALIVPKIYLVKTADDQQVIEAKVASIIPTLQASITTAKNDGKDVASLQTQLDTATTKQQAAQTISSSIESKTIDLQPTDYNSDHTILSGDRAQLTSARVDLTAAVTSLKAVRDGLKAL
jgi:hypothetical protein